MAAVESISAGGSTADATSHTLTYPGTISAGSIIFLIARLSNSGAITNPTGFTQLKNENPDASTDRTYIGWQTAVGNEDGTTFSVSTGSGRLAWVMTAVSDSGTPLVSTAATGGATQPDSPNFDPGLGAVVTLWATVAGLDGEQNTNPTEPTNYTTSATAGGTGTAGATTANCRIGIGHRVNTAASDDPGVWAWSSAAVTGWTAYTVAFPPRVSGPARLTRRSAHRFLTMR